MPRFEVVSKLKASSIDSIDSIDSRHSPEDVSRSVASRLGQHLHLLLFDLSFVIRREQERDRDAGGAAFTSGLRRRTVITHRALNPFTIS